MSQNILIGLTAIVTLGIAAQWLAWRIHLPSILFLLAFGLAAGPLTGWLKPNELLGDLLLPFVSLSVAVILFEGGLSLKLRELRSTGRVLLGLTTIGTLTAWLVTAIAARLLLHFDWSLAALLGAVLVVTGPTVIGPLLRHLRLGGNVGAILKWEGIVIDPLGATLAVLVFVVTRSEAGHGATVEAVMTLGRTLLAGSLLGVLGAALLVVLFARYQVPDSLHNAAVFTVTNLLQDEAGLLAVTVMGVGLANQKRVAIRHLVEFKENLTVLLISCLFIILSARLKPADLLSLDIGCFLFLATLIVVARPASVLLATLGSSLTWREKLFLCCMAPRGIVAAAVSSVFALEMASGHDQARLLPPVVFLVILGTVALYSLSAAPLARALGLARPDPQGILFVGASPWVRAAAAALQSEGVAVLVADSDWTTVSTARLAGVPTYFGSILGDHAFESIDFGEYGRLLAVTGNDEVNSLACLRFIEVFGRREVYQIAPGAIEGRREAVSLEQRGRLLFGSEITHPHLHEFFGPACSVKTTHLTKEFDYAAYLAHHGESFLPLFVIRPDGQLVPITAEAALAPQPGDKLVSLLRETVVPTGTAKEENE